MSAASHVAALRRVAHTKTTLCPVGRHRLLPLVGTAFCGGPSVHHSGSGRPRP